MALSRITNYIEADGADLNLQSSDTTITANSILGSINFKADADLILDGFLAHEVSSIVPEAISGTKDETQDLGTIKNKDGDVIYEDVLETLTEKDEGQTWTKTKTKNVYQGIDQSKLVPLLVKTIQELEARITVLESA